MKQKRFAICDSKREDSPFTTAAACRTVFCVYRITLNAKDRIGLIFIGLTWLVAVDRSFSAELERATGFIPGVAPPGFEEFRSAPSHHSEPCRSWRPLLAEERANLFPTNAISTPAPAASAPNQWRSFARGNGITVAIDDRGHLQTSVDGASWIGRDSGIPFSLYSLAFGKDRFVAVGNEGALVTSEDGVKWTVRDAGTDERLRSVTWADGMFVAVGYAGNILTSKKGRHWTQRDWGTTQRLQSITHGNGTFVVVGWNGVIFTSAKGIRWSKQTSKTDAHLHRVAYAGNAFVALGSANTMLVSTDGTNWTSTSPEQLSDSR